MDTKATEFPPRINKFYGCIMLLGLTCALMGLGLWVPARWKLYGIYPLVLGGLIGVCVQTLVKGWLESRGLRIAIALVIAVLVWNGQHLLTYQRYVAAQTTIRKSDPSHEWGITSQTVTPSGEGAAEQKQAAEFQAEMARIENIWRERMSFSGYLEARAKPLGVSDRVGAWGVYLGEMFFVLVGCLVGVRWGALTRTKRSEGLI
jgi:hypothetical protein